MSGDTPSISWSRPSTSGSPGSPISKLKASDRLLPTFSFDFKVLQCWEIPPPLCLSLSLLLSNTVATGLLF